MSSGCPIRLGRYDSPMRIALAHSHDGDEIARSGGRFRHLDGSLALLGGPILGMLVAMRLYEFLRPARIGGDEQPPLTGSEGLV